MAAGFQVGVELGRHAGNLDEVADALRDAARAARLAGVPRDAFGRFCARFPALLRPVERAGVAALDRAVAATESAAAAIIATASAYRDADQGFNPANR